MKLLRSLGSTVLSAAVLAMSPGCGQSKSDGSPPAGNPASNAPPAEWSIEGLLPKRAQPKLQTIKVWVGAEELVTELALTASQKRAGMMWRTNMPEGTAMLFVHPAPKRAGYWMRHCFVPLSIAYLDTTGVILEIHDMQPHNTNSVESASTHIAFALETPQGWFQRHNVRPGALVRTERGSLSETFFRQR